MILYVPFLKSVTGTRLQRRSLIMLLQSISLRYYYRRTTEESQFTTPILKITHLPVVSLQCVYQGQEEPVKITRTMPTIILKKTFKIKPSGLSFDTEKAFSFHGGISKAIINEVNRVLVSIRVGAGALTPIFKMDGHGHYYAKMNHESQKHYEEDFVVAIFDVLEKMGYSFRFQYDTNIQSDKIVGDSRTSREMFVFQKIPAATAALLQQPDRHVEC